MIITTDILDRSGVDYDWITLYVGISNNLIEWKALTIYAVKLMDDDKYEDDEFINELPWGIDESLKIDILTKMVLKFNFDMLIPQSKSWELEIRKLRYVILNYLRNTIKDDNELLRKIEEVYAEFNYPQDMEAFIAYMPVCYKGNNKFIINNFDNFLMVEKMKFIS